MKKITILVMAVAGVLSMTAYCLAAGKNYGTGESSSAVKDSALSGELKDDIRIIPVRAFRYGFDPDPIVVKQGEKVRLVVTATDVSHGLGIRDYGINLHVPAHETKSIEFSADKKGDFRIHCTVYCGSGHGNMHATLKVI